MGTFGRETCISCVSDMGPKLAEVGESHEEMTVTQGQCEGCVYTRIRIRG